MVVAGTASVKMGSEILGVLALLLLIISLVQADYTSQLFSEAESGSRPGSRPRSRLGSKPGSGKSTPKKASKPKVEAEVAALKSASRAPRILSQERLSPAWGGPEVSEQLRERVLASAGWEGGRSE